MNGLCVDMAYQLSAPFKSCASSPYHPNASKLSMNKLFRDAPVQKNYNNNLLTQYIDEFSLFSEG